MVLLTLNLLVVERYVEAVSVAVGLGREVDPEAAAVISRLQVVRDPCSVFCRPHDYFKITSTGLRRVNYRDTIKTIKFLDFFYLLNVCTKMFILFVFCLTIQYLNTRYIYIIYRKRRYLPLVYRLCQHPVSSRPAQ